MTPTSATQQGSKEVADQKCESTVNNLRHAITEARVLTRERQHWAGRRHVVKLADT